ncbi:DUF6498-containing protein [Natrinema sp. SYSU A 869]|uniref:DUF6498-containing protein n=1 Tax=Natrinema sp. SYSU A 869 TaxID=2871694 RepID=UPI001CA3884E|nr:DUF6498-containing protein [Natrinema sp. SYSU A 869]
MATDAQSTGRTAFIPVLVGNLLPLSGIVFLEWEPAQVLFVYWIEIGLFVVLYSGLVLFAEREPRPDERNVSPPTVSIPFLDISSDPIQLFDRLPPIYPRNVRYAIGLLVWGMVFWWCLALMMIVLPSHETLELSSSGEGVPIGDVISVVAAAFSPLVFGNVIVLLVSQLVTIRREFFGQQTYTRLSAPMIAEIPVRVIVFWFLLAIFAQLVFPLLLWPLYAAFDTVRVTEIAICALVISGKLTVEWSTFRSRWVAKSDGIARWFSHEDLQSGQ